jgi:hypothetical protein
VTMLIRITAAAAPLVKPDGARVHAADQCFLIARGGKPIGHAQQVIRLARRDGKPVWDVVVHQKAEAICAIISFPPRSDLEPIAFDGRKDGVEDVSLAYSGSRVAGHKAGEKETVAVNVTRPGPTWK